MKHGHTSGPFYRKFLVGNVGVEINGDGAGGLWLHTWNTSSGPPWTPPSQGTVHFDSEVRLREFCSKILETNVSENPTP